MLYEGLQLLMQLISSALLLLSKTARGANLENDDLNLELSLSTQALLTLLLVEVISSTTKLKFNARRLIF